MKIFLSVLKQVYKRRSRYFTDARNEIAAANGRLLHKINIVALLLLFVYYIATIFLFRNDTLSFIYQVFIIIHIILFLVSSYYIKKSIRTFWIIQVTCFLFIISIMIFTIAISIIPFPDRPGIFFPIFYLAISLIFMFPFFEITLLMTAMNILYIFLVINMKTDYACAYDIFSSITVWFVSLTITYLVLNIRLREGEANYHLKKVSFIDVLTSLPNRRSFNIHIEEVFSNCIQKQLPIAIIMVDIDNFKHYNDTYGHTAGDVCLAQIGSAFANYASRNGLYIARYGGEEIVAVIDGQQAHQAKEYAEDLQKCVRDCRIPTSSNPKGIVTISLGVAMTSDPRATNSLSLINKADQALYSAKENGRDRIEISE